VFFIGATLYGLMAIQYEYILWALILAGLGWNFTYIGGGTLLAQSVDNATNHRWQGINDTLIATSATLGAFLPAPMLSGFGWNSTNMIFMPLCVLGVILTCCVMALNKQNDTVQYNT
jgi:predicted MFS family arabinose efflux permease